MKPRLFIAIDFPEKTKKEIAGLTRQLKSKYPYIRWEKEENLHLTLKFLGWVETKLKAQNSNVKTTTQNLKLQKIIKGMEKSVQGVRPFWFQPEKLGYFLGQSLIVWLGVKTEQRLFQTVKNLEKEMAKLGFRKERRVFSAHITIARAKRIVPRKKWQRIANEIRNFPTPIFSKFKVSEIVLMKSQLTPKGSIYTVVNKVSQWF